MSTDLPSNGYPVSTLRHHREPAVESVVMATRAERAMEDATTSELAVIREYRSERQHLIDRLKRLENEVATKDSVIAKQGHDLRLAHTVIQRLSIEMESARRTIDTLNATIDRQYAGETWVERQGAD